MPLAEVLRGIFRPKSENGPPRDDVPWYLEYGGRALGIVGAFFAILFGLYNCLGILLAQISCLVSGILQMCIGFVVMTIEASFCCSSFDYAKKLADTADNRPYWNRAVFYCGVAIFPVILCPGLASIFGCGLIFGTGILYGMMAIGKKATVEEMRNAAAAVSSPSSSAGANNKFNNTNTRSNLVDNAQGISFTGAPAYDSNV